MKVLLVKLHKNKIYLAEKKQSGFLLPTKAKRRPASSAMLITYR